MNKPVALTQVEIMEALTLGIPLYTHPAKEQSNLVNVVKDHIKDLQECVLILNDSMLVNTANEMKVAIKELKDAIDTHPVKKLSRMDVYELAIESGFMLSTQYGEAEHKLMPVSDGDTLVKFARAILRKAQEK